MTGRFNRWRASVTEERPLTRLEYAGKRILDGMDIANETWHETRVGGILLILLVAFFCPFVFVQALITGPPKRRTGT